ncbi:hypothetical protein HMPREF9123_0817 [Neisseria bacilliformis ATCC BAA-1200]|uniref:Uncharacterized protein n=1 Tax=Neisseria bacilliformis ATCC BAA-1200 TaxID=888742 RepID=F2BAR3_9NEIS|nr:hypothetical protein HMPREF9123_0817 [Neisseria bacilliformis ATCC BAA-1200]
MWRKLRTRFRIGGEVVGRILVSDVFPQGKFRCAECRIQVSDLRLLQGGGGRLKTGKTQCESSLKTSSPFAGCFALTIAAV